VLTHIARMELARYGITANALAPAARTQMTEGPFGEIMRPPADGSFDHYAPENVAPLVVWLCSEASAACTGRVFEVEGGKLSLANGWKTGQVINKHARWQPAELSDVVAQLMQDAPPAQKVYGT
jgi:NAD(P)-dependent dehydrogenase (short-subunit alcohol dehydrogenase family)